jgi:hypothetical protein
MIERPDTIASNAARLLEVGILTCVGSMIAVVPILVDRGHDALGLRGAFATVWLVGMGIGAIAFAVGRIRAQPQVTAGPSPTTRDAVLTVMIAALAIAVGLAQIGEPNLRGQSFAPTGAGHAALVAGAVALVLVIAALVRPRAAVTSRRLAVEIATAANLVLVLDAINILHRNSLEPLLLAICVAAAAVGLGLVLARTDKSPPR